MDPSIYYKVGFTVSFKDLSLDRLRGGLALEQGAASFLKQPIGL